MYQQESKLACQAALMYGIKEYVGISLCDKHCYIVIFIPDLTTRILAVTDLGCHKIGSVQIVLNFEASHAHVVLESTSQWL